MMSTPTAEGPFQTPAPTKCRGPFQSPVKSAVGVKRKVHANVKPTGSPSGGADNRCDTPLLSRKQRRRCDVAAGCELTDGELDLYRAYKAREYAEEAVIFGPRTMAWRKRVVTQVLSWMSECQLGTKMSLVCAVDHMILLNMGRVLPNECVTACFTVAVKFWEGKDDLTKDTFESKEAMMRWEKFVIDRWNPLSPTPYHYLGLFLYPEDVEAAAELSLQEVVERRDHRAAAAIALDVAKSGGYPMKLPPKELVPVATKRRNE